MNPDPFRELTPAEISRSRVTKTRFVTTPCEASQEAPAVLATRTSAKGHDRPRSDRTDARRSDGPYPKGKKALELARAGFRVFPVKVDDPKLSPEKIKEPAIAQWQKRATTDPDQIKRWWKQTNWNIGIATGPGGDRIVSDYDMKPGQKGRESLALHEYVDGLPQSFRVQTPSSGIHVYLRAPTGVFIHNSVSKLAPNCDIRGNASGGYVLAPGSTIHGVPYVAIGDPTDISEIPEYLLEQLNTIAKTEDRKRTQTPMCELDRPLSIEAAVRYLKGDAPVALEGSGEITRHSWSPPD
jgi:hypothetical protein